MMRWNVIDRFLLLVSLLAVLSGSTTVHHVAALRRSPAAAVIVGDTAAAPRRRREATVRTTTLPRGGEFSGRRPTPGARYRNTAVTTTSSSSSAGVWSSVFSPVTVGTLVLTLIERLVHLLFRHCQITFPAQLGGCGLLLLLLLLLDRVHPGAGQAVYTALVPATTFLTKYLPVFFVPGLAMLPLAPSVGSSTEIAKVLLVTVLGFVYTLYSVAYAVLFLRKLDGNSMASSPAVKVVAKPRRGPRGSAAAAPPPMKPFADATMTVLLKTTVLTGLINVVVQYSSYRTARWSTPIQTVFLFAATCTNYVGAARLPAAFTQAVHPLLTSTVLTWLVLFLSGTTTTGTMTFLDGVRAYKTGSLAWQTAGAGDLLLFCLGPSVVSFAVSMYSRKQLLMENFCIVVAAMVISSVGGLFGTAAFGAMLQLGGTSSNALLIRLSLLTRNITTSLAIPVTQLLGGDISIAVVVVVLTGIIGAQYGKRLLDLVHIHDPITRGLAVGSAAQGLGVSSMVDEADAFPFAAMAMALTAVAGTVLVSIPAVKDALVHVCRS